MRIAQKTFKRAIQERLVFLEGEADRAAKLLAGEAVFYVGALNIGRRRIERLPRREGLADGKGLAASMASLRK